MTNPNGTPVWRARIELADTRTVVFTDTHGRFALGEVAFPCKLLISHARFVEAVVELPAAPGALAITLEPRPVLLDEVVVSGSGGSGEFTPLTMAASAAAPADQTSPPSTLAQLVSGVPGVAENGQGGMFQVYSVRGMSRERVLTLVSGMRVVSERRAGVSTSFIDPLLLSSADVLRGPSSTFYGSGALGGVVQVSPREFKGWSAHAGYESEGLENVQAVGWGDRGWSVGLARREAGNGEMPAGQEINSHFKQYSATVARRWQGSSRRYELLILPALARDIGKATSDFPARVTNYPRERHLLAKLAVTSEDRWRADVFVHPNDLHTRNNTEDGEQTDIFNDSFDLGFNLRRPLRLARSLTGSMGIDYFGRRGIDSRELSTAAEVDSASAGAQELRTLAGGEQDEAALFGSLSLKLRAATLEGGSRVTWHRQQNGDRPPAGDATWSGFAGAVLPIGTDLLVSTEIGTGLRFPSLSERFFTGTTPRGGVIGNPDLEPERSLNLDFGARWQPGRHSLAGHIFHNSIEDYIERVEIAPDVLSYANLISGDISGFEIEASYDAGGGWLVAGSGHLIRGRGEGEEPLADVPPDRFDLLLRRARERWRWDLKWQFRDAKEDPGPGERDIAPARLVSASARWALRPDLSLSLSGSNLLDEEYFGSADSKAPLARGRSIAVGVAWGDQE